MILAEDDDLFSTATIGNLKPTFTAGRHGAHVGVEHEIANVVREVEDGRTAVLVLLHLEATNLRRQERLAGVEERVGMVRATTGHPGLGWPSNWGGQGVSDWSGGIAGGRLGLE